MKKIFLIGIIVLSLVAIVLSSVGCATEPDAAPAAPASNITTDITALKTWRDSIESATGGLAAWIATKNSQVQTNTNDIAALKSGGTAATNSYTKAEIDTKFNNLISNLSNDQLTDLKNRLGITGSSSSTGTSTGTTTSTGTVSWSTNPVTLPVVYSGLGNLSIADASGAVGHNLGVPTITPAGYAQPYTLHIVNNTSAITYVKPVITLQLATTGGVYTYPQLIYYNVSFSCSLGSVQGEARSNFHQSALGNTQPAYFAGMTTCSNAINNYCPYLNQVQFTPTTVSDWILQSGWWMHSQSNPVSTAATTGVITGAFPVNLSPSNANTQPTPSFTLTTVAPALNGYGEYQMTPGQSLDVLVSLQIATLQQCSIQITNSASYRQ